MVEMRIPLRRFSPKFWENFLRSTPSQKADLPRQLMRKTYSGQTRMISFNSWGPKARDVFTGWLLEQSAYLARENKIDYIDFYEEEYASLFVLKHL